METIEFQQLDETLYYKKLANGLDVYILPKKGFSKTFVTFTTKYGSVDRTFTPIGEKEPITVPDGIAHFLEHKMFEKEEGDVFQSSVKEGLPQTHSPLLQEPLIYSLRRTIFLKIRKHYWTLCRSRILQKKRWKRKRGLLDRKLRCTMISPIGGFILAQSKTCITIIR